MGYVGEDLETEKMMRNINKSSASYTKENLQKTNLNGRKVKEVREVNGKKILIYMGVGIAILLAALASKKANDRKASEYDHTVIDYSTGDINYYNDETYKPSR